MKSIYLIGVLILFCTIPFVSAQTKKSADVDVEQMPAFPGGEQSLIKFLNTNVKYPEVAQEMGIQGTVAVRFVVTKTGTIDSIEVLRSVDTYLDKEALRVVSLLPKFIPGKINGKNTSCWFTLPISFKLQDEVKTQKGK
ncbi:MAG: energy transducer TonB [Bacteroidia bacterium]|nr:energy transducer TonB [Bacteroidia bacterium]